MFKNCFVVPYYNDKKEIPEMTRLWIDSCFRNPTINWIIFTNCEFSGFDIPLNITVVDSDFDNIGRENSR